MEHESMRERKGAGTILRAGAAMALVAALAACGGGDGDAGANQDTEMSDTPSLAERISMANAAAGALSDESDGDAVEAARSLITAAQEAIDALPGGEQEAQDNQLVGAILLVEGQEARVTRETNIANAVTAANAAAEALTDESEAADVTEARRLIVVAQGLGATDEALADADKTVMAQQKRVTDEAARATAVGNANGAADGLGDSSDAADVAAARALIGTASDLGATDEALASAEAKVKGHERRLDLATADAAIKAAGTAVNAVKDDSAAGVVTTAEGNIQTAKARVKDLEHLTDADRDLLNGQIALVEGNLGTRKTARDTAIAAKATADAKARTAAAKNLHDRLTTSTGPTAVAGRPTSSLTGDLSEAYDAAVKEGTGSEEKASVAVRTTKGADIDSEIPPGNLDSSPTLGSGDLVKSANAEYISGSGFASAEGVIVNHNDEKGEGDREVKGSYGGATGTFTCAADSTGCTSRKTNDGIQLLSTDGAGWTFTRDTGQKYKVDDPHYAQFGWWLNDVDAADPAVGAWYGNGAASDGAAFTALSTLNAATGSATYTGDAIGQAAFYDPTTDDENIGGAFTATATLNADFDDNMLGGEITGFKVGDVDTDWKVELMKHTISGVGVDSSQTTSTKWTADGTAAPAASVTAGDWSAAFYDIPKDQHQPKGVAGGFTSHHGDEGRMVGAFGAER